MALFEYFTDLLSVPPPPCDPCPLILSDRSAVEMSFELSKVSCPRPIKQVGPHFHESESFDKNTSRFRLEETKL